MAVGEQISQNKKQPTGRSLKRDDVRGQGEKYSSNRVKDSEQEQEATHITVQSHLSGRSGSWSGQWAGGLRSTGRDKERD